MCRSNFGADLRQEEVRHPIRRPDADLTAERICRGPYPRLRQPHRLFGHLRPFHQARAILGQRIALGGFDKEHPVQRLFQPSHPPPQRRRIQPQKLARAGKALLPCHRQKQAQVIPILHNPLASSFQYNSSDAATPTPARVQHLAFLQNYFAQLPLFAGFLQD